MLELDGEVVNLNDQVYDIANGHGTVLELSERYITVQFLNRRRLTFKDNGMVGDVRRLFWHNPLVVAPPKSAAKWQHFTHIIAGVEGFLSASTTP